MASMQIYSSFSYGDEISTRSFFLENGLRHQQYANAISTNFSVQVPFYDVYDTRMVDEIVRLMKDENAKLSDSPAVRNWLLNHATLHDAEIKAITNQQNFDLYDMDVTDASSFYDWLNVHASIHDYVDQALGV